MMQARDKGNGLVEITGNCRRCNKEQKFDVEKLGFVLWDSGTIIQTALPNVSSDNREFMISQVCGPCFHEMFPSV